MRLLDETGAAVVDADGRIVSIDHFASASSSKPIDIVELRVHGVSGTSPESLLRFPAELVERVYGDGDAGFHRRRVLGRDPIGTVEAEGALGRDVDRDADAANTVDWTATEAFSWGGLTSGPASRALWLLFLPFILVNLAHWMLPPVNRDRAKWASAAVCLLRLLGLAMTLTLLVSAADCLLDVVAWQCTADGRCSAKLGPLKFLGSWPTGWVLAVAAAPIAALVLGLLLIGRANPRLGAPPPDPSEPPVDASPLSVPSFWNADESITRLRHCHVAAWLSGLGLLVVMAPLLSGPSPRNPLVVGFAVVDAVCLLASVLGTWSKQYCGRNDKQPSRRATARTRALWITALAGAIGSSVSVGCSFHPGRDGRFILPGMEWTLWCLLGLQALLLLGLFVAVGRSKVEGPTDPGFSHSLHGYTAAFVAMMAFFIGGGISLGAGLWLARFLGEPVRTGVSAVEGPSIALSPLYFDGALANMALLGITVALAVAVVTCVFRTRRGLAQRLSNPADPVGFPAEAVSSTADVEASRYRHDVRSRRIRSVAGAWAAALVTDRAPWIISFLLCFTLIDLVCCLLIVELHHGATRLNLVVTACGAATAFLMALVIAIAYKAFRQRSMRRVVGVLWDVMTFWPRASHPFGPPCYGQRAVPDLRDRVWQLAHRNPQSAVVIASHSQGTIIAVAALLLSWRNTMEASGDDQSQSLPASSRVALLTFGSPLRRLYAKNFPAYFSHQALSSLADHGMSGRWLNLWAHTDPIGGWVLSSDEIGIETPDSTVDRWVRDATGVQPVDGSYPPICGHSGFWLRDEYRKALVALSARLAAEHVDSSSGGIGTRARYNLFEAPVERIVTPPPPVVVRQASRAE